MRDGTGDLYGNTVEGGDPACPDGNGLGCGTIFKLVSGGAFTTLHDFVGEPTDGAVPNSRLIRDALGNLYGTTARGGDHQHGTVFKLDAAGQESVVYHFTGEADGSAPQAGLIIDDTGNLYGTTAFGGNLDCGLFGNEGCGTVFKMSPSGVLTTLRVFGQRQTDLKFPSPALIEAAARLGMATG